jgi:DnaJ-class molecular chaperone
MAIPKKSRRQAVLLLGACLAVTQPPQPANAATGWSQQQQQQKHNHLHDQSTSHPATPTSTSFRKKPTFVTIIRGGSNSHSNSSPDAAESPSSTEANKKYPKHPSPNPKKKKKESSPGTNTGPPPKQKASSSSSSIVEDILKETDYYKILGIDKQHATSVDDNAIKKAYRRRALLTHPDKTGGDRRAFDKVAEAYEILSDSHKRHLYDRYGKDGVNNNAAQSQQQQQPFMNAEDLFRSFFGGGNPFSGSSSGSSSSKPFTNRTMRFQLEVSLEDMYYGRSVTVQIHNHKKTITVDIPRGAYAHQHIRVHGAMDHDDQSSPGDLDFILTQRPHPMYTRKGHDLAISIPISLSESLCGFQRKIRHLNGHKIHIVSSGSSSGTNHPVTDGDWQVLKGYGMPKDTLGTEYGDLFVQLHVTASPSLSTSHHRLSETERAELQRLLRKLEGKSETASLWPYEDTSHREDSGDHDNVKRRLERANPHDFGHASGRQQAEEEDVDEEGHPFFGRQQQFFWSSSSSGQPQSNPFFGDFVPPSGDAETQCRQM